MLHTQYKSSTKAKADVRRQRAFEDMERDTTGTASKQQHKKDEEKQYQQSTSPTMNGNNTSPRKKARITTMAQPDPTDEMTTQPLLEMPPPEEQALAFSSFSSISSLMAPMGIPGYDALLSFPSLPNLSRSSVGNVVETMPLRPAANQLGAVQFNQKIMPQKETHEQQQQQRQRQCQFAATRTSGIIGCSGGEVEPVPFMEPLSSATHRSASFGETIDEMYQAQLFSSDNTLESSSSGSMAKLHMDPPGN
jgi:hypothetical protein